MADNNATSMVVLLIIGAAILGGFFMWIRARERCPLQGGAALHRALPQSHVEPWARHLERAMADAHGHVVRRLGLPPGRTGVQRHPDRADLHSGDPGFLVSSLADRRLVAIQQRTHILAGFMMTIAGLGFLLGIVKHSPSPWAFAPGLRSSVGTRGHAHPVGQRRAVGISRGTPGRDLRPSLSVSNRARPLALRSPTRSSSRGPPRLPAPTPSP